MKVRIEITGPRGSGKSITARAFMLFLSALPGLKFEHDEQYANDDSDDKYDVIEIDMSNEDRNMLVDFIIMRESQRRN